MREAIIAMLDFLEAFANVLFGALMVFVLATIGVAILAGCIVVWAEMIRWAFS